MKTLTTQQKLARVLTMQEQFDNVQLETKRILKLYSSSILTLPEFLFHMSVLDSCLNGIKMAGLIDPNTGLRYPAE